MQRRSLLATTMAAFGATTGIMMTEATTEAAAAPADDRENTLFLDLKDGRVTIKLRPDLAPKHVERIKTLARKGFYDGTPFHRVIEGFMAQGGDPTGTGTGGSDLPDLPAEFSPPSKARFLRGVCGMARTANPNSANSQFFIMFTAVSSLDGEYTIWGSVTAGMELVDKIKRGAGQSGMVREPDRVVKMQVAADVPA